jgi:cyclic AMP-dependent transcription factor ATF-2
MPVYPGNEQANLSKGSTLCVRESILSEKTQYQGKTNATMTTLNSSDLSYVPHAFLAPIDVEEVKMHNVFETSAIPLLQTRSKETIVYGSYDLNDSSALDQIMDLATSSALVQWPSTVGRHGFLDERQRKRIQDHVDFTPCATKKQRTLEKSEPGSARAMHLEKNRKAASKCRTKQKRQQDSLVTTAQDMERRNKLLKWEVELLKGDLKGLMELVWKHEECSDGRLRNYAQRKADRLSTHDKRSLIMGLFSLKGGFHGREKYSGPEQD